ncbi:hypothetical protein [Leifsonia xyli]|uniref:hypothetical protein n=1 Tax=Leifsonia xyli TaxID=1575 RepID=UPI003D66B15B
MKFALTLVALSGGGAVLTGFAPVDSDIMNAADALAAIERVAPEVVEEAAATSVGDLTAAAAATVNGVEVVLPVDARDGISIGGAKVGLPFAGQADDATPSPTAGVVAYDNNNGSTTVPVVHNDGRVQITTVIHDADAPKRYDYQMALGSGQRLLADRDGSARVVDDSAETLLTIAAPWARDASGNDVPTHYEITGDTLTQVVDFDGSTAFPVVADPSYRLYTIHYSRSDVEQMWRMMNNINNVCHYIPLPYLGALSCGAPANLATAITRAHYQAKKIDAVYHACGYNYCSYYTYSVVS